MVKRAPYPRVVRWIADHDEESLHLSVLTFGELQKGISKLPPGPRRERLQAWVDGDLARRFSDRLIDVGRDVAVRWGQLAGAVERRGKRVPVLDGLLAATALAGDLTLVTRNTSDMRETGVSLVDPWAS
jgi:predicted nucleic acid-binding protein